MAQQTIVIGGGIIGLSIAVTLQKRGADIMLIDAAALGMGASYGNAGHLAAEQVYPVADSSILKQLPAMLTDPLGPLRIDWRYLPKLAPWLWQTLLNMRPSECARIHRALLAINSRCMADWHSFATEWKLQQHVHFQGSLLVCEKSSTAEMLRQQSNTLNEIGVRNQWLQSAEVLAREPSLSPRHQGALLYPDTGHITDLPAVTEQLRRAFTDAGGQIREYCTVKNAGFDSNGKIALDTETGRFYAEKVILCAGAHSKALARQLTGISVPLDTERGYHLMLPEEKQRLSIPVASADRRFIITPMSGGLRLAGTVEYAGLAAPPNMDRARRLLPLAQGMLTKPLNTAGISEWMGFRPTTSDSLPVIDRHRNVFLAFGHQHLGLTQAATTAKAIAALYFDEASALDLQPYRLHRFA